MWAIDEDAHIRDKFCDLLTLAGITLKTVSILMVTRHR